MTAKQVACRQCGQYFSISTATQLKCRQNGWDLPSLCEQCKHDALLIKGALGALKGQFPFAVETGIEKRGILFTDKVAVVRNKTTREVVAEVRMDEKGIFFTERVAVATTPDKKKISETRDETKGILFPERVARTYSGTPAKRTHETRNVTEGILFPTRHAETTSLTDSDPKKVVTKSGKEGLFFVRRFLDTKDKK